MKQTLISDALKHLPLCIEHIEWKEPLFIIWGKNWKFSTVGSWRIINDSMLIQACYDKGTSETLKEIENMDIISIEFQSTQLPLDPVFILSNGYKIEIFATTHEPWVCELPSE